MKYPIFLLDLLASEMKCCYVSDLKYLSKERRDVLVKKLKCLQPRTDENATKEWNDALDYLVKAPPEKTAEEARVKLIELLSQDRKGGSNGK